MRPSTATGQRDRAVIAMMLAASVASTIGGLPFNSLPVMLGSLADSFALDSKAVGLIGSICFAGYLVGTLGAPLWINRLDWRWLTVISAAGSAASFALSASVRELGALYVMWALIGFFASTMTCLGMRILSDLPNKVRAFGVRQGVELSLTAAVLFALPPLVIATWKYPGAAWALAAVVAALGLSALWLPRHPIVALPASTTASASASGRSRIPARAWFVLGVFFVFLAGNIALWAFLERIGKAMQITPAEMGLVFAVLKLLGGGAAFFCAWIGDRAGQRLPYWVVLAAIAAGLALIAQSASFASFALGVWLWEFAFTCGCVFQSALIARSDASGRAVVLIPAVFALGSMVGPAAAGYLVAAGSFGPLLLLALATSVVPVLAHALRPTPVGAAAGAARTAQT